MSKKAVTLLNEILITTAFFGGVWTAIEINPEVALIGALGKVMAELIGPATAARYVAWGKLMSTLVFVGSLVGAFFIGRKTALLAFGTLWVAGYLLALQNIVGVYLLIAGYLLGMLSISLHTNARVGPPPRGGPGGF